MRSFTFEIKKDECVGDSVGKHNYNLMSLDTKLCNLSSTFFTIQDNYKKYFDDYVSYIPTLTTAYNQFNSKEMFRYKLVNATVQTMSSYWNRHQFSVQLNTNISRTYSSVSIGSFTKSDFQSLCSACFNYLNNNFPPQNFMLSTTAHVIAYYYTSLQPIMENSVVVTANPENFSSTQRDMNVSLTKAPISISGMNIFSFSNISRNDWALTRVLPELPPGYVIRYTTT
jgi:hypothetical protein